MNQCNLRVPTLALLGLALMLLPTLAQLADAQAPNGRKPSHLGHPARGIYRSYTPLIVIPLQWGSPSDPYWSNPWMNAPDWGRIYPPAQFNDYSGPSGTSYGLPNHGRASFSHSALRPMLGQPMLERPMFEQPMLGQGYPTSNAAPVVYPTILTKAKARSAQQRAELAFRNGDYHLAASLARQVVTLDAENGVAWLFSSQTRFAIGDYDSAADDLLTAIDLLPPEQWNYVINNYGHFYGRNDYVRQMDQLNQFLSDRPVYVAALLVRGHHWASLGHWEAADQDLALALSKRPYSSQVRQLYDWMERSMPPLVASDPQIPTAARLGTPSEGPNSSIAPQLNPAEPESELLPEPDGLESLETLDDFQLPQRDQ